jgi:LmbE family N-acetylglucosaminyl deacetylase
MKITHKSLTRALWIIALLGSQDIFTQGTKAAPNLKPDERFKTDILLVAAHPDDETAVSGYLAKAIYDEHRRLAVVFGTRGDAGGNAIGYEQAAALGAVREIEARRALASFGVLNVWFLGGPDTAGQDVLRSLETWHHGSALEQAVRIVRLTRPEVILTWLPAYVAGENHGDHQAAGVIATEAFDMAGDPTVFPEQLAAPRDHRDIGNLTEGLRPWQPQKLYYFSDASHTDFLAGKGPQYPSTATSPSRQVPYYRLAAEEQSFHLTQGDTGQVAKQALAKGDFRAFQEPVRLIFGKSHVKANPAGDVFEGVVTHAISFVTTRGHQRQPHQGLSLELGGPWAFYGEFWRVHNLEHLAQLVAPEVALGPGQILHVPLLIHNGASESQEVTLTVALPQGWSEQSGSARYPVSAQDVYPVQAALLTPSHPSQQWQQVTWKAQSQGQTIGSITLRVYLVSGGLPQ